MNSTHRSTKRQPPDTAHAVDANLHDDISKIIDTYGDVSYTSDKGTQSVGGHGAAPYPPFVIFDHLELHPAQMQEMS
jgi:hypothetical protein